MPKRPAFFLRVPPVSLTMSTVYCARSVAFGLDGEEEAGTILQTNVPQELWLWPQVGYGWGEQRREGVTLALNVLHRLIPAEPGTIARDWHIPLATHPDALALCCAFQDAFLEFVPFWGGRLPGGCVRDWIEASRIRLAEDGLDLGIRAPLEVFPRWPY